VSQTDAYRWAREGYGPGAGALGQGAPDDENFIALRNQLSSQNLPTHPPNHTLDYNINGEHHLNRHPSAGTDPDAEELLDFSASNAEGQMS